MADQQALALVRSRPAYAIEAIAHPASKVVLITGFAIATMMASLLVAAAVLVGAATAAWLASGSQNVQRHFDEEHLHRTRKEQLQRRQAQLLAAGVEPSGLVELSSLVDAVERSDRGWTARRFQLDELVDRYVSVSIGHQRCLHAMQATDRSCLIRALATTPHASVSDVAKCRRELIERRIATWDRTAIQATRLEDELGAITDLVRLLAQRAACPDAMLDCDLVQWRLAELDAEDAAMLALTAGSEAEAEAEAA